MSRALAALVTAAGLLTACGGNTGRNTSGGQTAAQQPAMQQSPQTGSAKDRAIIAYGRELILHTRAHLGRFVVANMDCAACHIDGGTRARGGSFVGTAAAFPQWNTRAKRTILLQDRLAECFLYSMNGRPPAYTSREMVAMNAYITSLSRGIPIGATPDPNVRLASISLGRANVSHGRQIYSRSCEACHGANGAGQGDVYPPLWGPTSFNSGAGMHRLRTMAGFVRYNMPQNAPGSLNDQEAYDVAAYVLSHARPALRKSRLIAFPAEPANFF